MENPETAWLTAPATAGRGEAALRHALPTEQPDATSGPRPNELAQAKWQHRANQCWVLNFNGFVCSNTKNLQQFRGQKTL